MAARSSTIAAPASPAVWPGGRRWIVVQTLAHREQAALVNLERQAFTTYCPFVRRRVRHARRTSDVLRPLFPGYLFVAVEGDELRWRPIASTLGVRALVRSGDQPGFVPAEFIASLRAREVDGALAPARPTYVAGDKVRLTGGPFDGLTATVIDMDEKGRLLVLMNMLNQQTRVAVATAAVSPLN